MIKRCIIQNLNRNSVLKVIIQRTMPIARADPGGGSRGSGPPLFWERTPSFFNRTPLK